MRIGIGLGIGFKPTNGGAPPVPAPPVNIEAPLLSGTGAVESTVTCSSGVWTGSPTPTYTYIFYVDGVEEQNSSSNEFFVRESYDGLTITAEVTATNTEGSATEPASNSIVVGTIPVNTVEPTLSPSGIQSTGTLITINERTWDGTPPLTFEYRWLRDGVVIDGEDGKTYTIAVEDDGTVITAEVRASNAYGVSIWVLTSNQVDAVNAVAPSNVTTPVISGSTSLGSVLSTTNGTWSGVPATFSYTYQWKRNGSPIVGATASTYTTVVADSTANITCDVTADNGVAPTATAGSNTLTMANYTPANTVAPSVTGTAVVGQTLSTTNGTWTNSPSTFSYQWYRGATLISGATNSTYVLVQADAGQNIKCTVTATNSAGSASADSNTLAIIETIIQTSGSSAAGAYDINMVLNSSYANYSTQIVRIRRSGDNAEANYGVSSNGYVDWSAITTWVSAGGGTQNGFIVTIFDQSGNGRNFTQSTPSAQMQIISSGVLLTDTGAGSGAVARAAMRASGSQFYEIPSSTAMFNFIHNGADGWVLGVQRFGTTSNPAATYQMCGNFGGSGLNVGFNIAYIDVPANNNASFQGIWRGGAPQPAQNITDNVITSNQTSIINARFDADNATLANRAINWVNNGAANSNNTSNGVAVTPNASFNLQWGANGNGGFILTGSLQRLIIWNANLSTQRTTLTTLTNSYYGAY